MPNPYFDPTAADRQDIQGPVAEPTPAWQPVPRDQVELPPVDLPAAPADEPTQPPPSSPPPPPSSPEPPPPPPMAIGQLCSGNDCPASQVCLFMEENASQGICLPGCTALHTFCENIPDPFVAGCAEYFNPDVGEVNVCVLFCRYKSSQFPCPNDTDYTCKSYGKEIGICIAK